jgi:hypothetical protein
MREAFFILFVILILLALTALRYRKQIAGVIGVAKMLKDVKDQAGQGKTIRGEQPSVQLVNCAACGVWVPQNKAVDKGGKFYCSSDCAMAKVT